MRVHDASYLCDLVCASDLCTLARGFHGTFGENNRQVIARDPTLTHSLYSALLPSPPPPSPRPRPRPRPRSFQCSDTRPETPRLVFSPQFFRHICFCLATTMHRLRRYDIKICAAMYLLLSFSLHCTSAPFSPVLLLISLFPVCRHVTGKEDFASRHSIPYEKLYCSRKIPARVLRPKASCRSRITFSCITSCCCKFHKKLRSSNRP